MKLRYLLLAVLSLFALSMQGCGGHGDGLNGAVTVTATAAGTTINATATYTNPTKTNLIGQDIELAYAVGGGPVISLGTVTTNNSGSVSFAFVPAPFVGQKTITVIAKADKLEGFATVQITGLSVALTQPQDATSTPTNATPGTIASIPVPALADFLKITDPFGDNAPHAFRLTGSVSGATVAFSNGTNSTIIFATSSGDFPGATVSIATPAVGGTASVTITWTVTELTTDSLGNVVLDNAGNPIPLPGGLNGSTTSKVTLTNQAPTT